MRYSVSSNHSMPVASSRVHRFTLILASRVRRECATFCVSVFTRKRWLAKQWLSTTYHLFCSYFDFIHGFFFSILLLSLSFEWYINPSGELCFCIFVEFVIARCSTLPRWLRFRIFHQSYKIRRRILTRRCISLMLSVCVLYVKRLVLMDMGEQHWKQLLIFRVAYSVEINVWPFN